jgi:hypothetical protein
LRRLAQRDRGRDAALFDIDDEEAFPGGDELRLERTGTAYGYALTREDRLGWRGGAAGRAQDRAAACEERRPHQFT